MVSMYDIEKDTGNVTCALFADSLISLAHMINDDFDYFAELRERILHADESVCGQTEIFRTPYHVTILAIYPQFQIKNPSQLLGIIPNIGSGYVGDPEMN